MRKCQEFTAFLDNTNQLTPKAVRAAETEHKIVEMDDEFDEMEKD
eukprot:SAG31_NODE_41816_length_274_cov_0.862857_1_plen_44_part_10